MVFFLGAEMAVAHNPCDLPTDSFRQLSHKVRHFGSSIPFRLSYSEMVVVVNLVRGHRGGFSNRNRFRVAASSRFDFHSRFRNGRSRSRIHVLLPPLDKRQSSQVGKIFKSIYTKFKLDRKQVVPQQSSAS